MVGDDDQIELAAAVCDHREVDQQDGRNFAALELRANYVNGSPLMLMRGLFAVEDG